jgi:hypothetical protein
MGRRLLKFLIDECLSPKLVELAIGRGFVASSHVVWIGKAGLKDWELKKIMHVREHARSIGEGVAARNVRAT